MSEEVKDFVECLDPMFKDQAKNSLLKIKEKSWDTSVKGFIDSILSFIEGAQECKIAENPENEEPKTEEKEEP